MRVRLFVYGTLKRGHCRSDVLAGQRFLGLARTAARYRLFDCGDYPGLVESPDDGVAVEGEVWEVDDACLTVLDEIEGVAVKLYERCLITLQPPHAADEVHAYFYRRDTAGLRDGGGCW